MGGEAYTKCGQPVSFGATRERPVIKVDIAPQWRFRRDHDRVPTIVLLELLNDIRTTGRITSAAARSKFSYRHAWGMIEAWGNIFGAPLVERRRGKGTKLTALGEKLVWAGQRFQARLGPQLQNISQELEAEINTILSEGGGLSASTQVMASRFQRCATGFPVRPISQSTCGMSPIRPRSSR